MTTPAHLIIERDAHFTWFGLGLWDAPAGTLVSDGITVRVFTSPVTERSFVRFAVPNRSGAFVVPHLPLPDVTSPPVQYVIEVVDTLGRFVSFLMPIVPADQWGFVQPGCGAAMTVTSPAGEQTPLPLFSLPARPAPNGAAVVRAKVTDAATGGDAAFAVVEVRHNARTLGRGIADERGEVVVIFAYPEPEPPPAWSPPAPPPRPQRLAEQQWPLDVAVNYRPGLARTRTARDQPPLVNLCDVLSQPPAAVVAGSPGWTADDTTLRYGEPLVFGGSIGVWVRAN